MARRTIRSKPSTKLAGDPAVASYAYKRIDRMTLMGLTVPKLIAVAKIPRPWMLACRAATYQAGRGSNADQTQAAHNLPRDLLLNGRPVWSYARDEDVLDTHARIKMQINYAAAATMTVPRESNYIDSRWEETRLPEDWLAYLRVCLDNSANLGTGPLDGNIRGAALIFKERCKSTLAETIDRILDGDYYEAHAEALESYFLLYKQRLDQYDPAARLASMWAIYQRPNYR